MKNIHKVWTFFLLLLLLILSSISCTKNTDTPEGGGGSGGEPKIEHVTVLLSIRGLDNSVQSIDVRFIPFSPAIETTIVTVSIIGGQADQFVKLRSDANYRVSADVNNYTVVITPAEFTATAGKEIIASYAKKGSATLSVTNTIGSLLNATVGSTAEQTLTIKNSSSTQSAATITQISGLSGVLSIVPGGTCALNTTLNDTQTCTIKIKLNTQNQLSLANQNISIAYSVNGIEQTQLTQAIPYSVIAQPHATLSVINTDGSLLDATVGSTAEQTLTIKSSSSTQSAATITQISGLSGVLSIVPGGTCALNTTLNDTQTCTIKIKLNTQNQLSLANQNLSIAYSVNGIAQTQLTQAIQYSVIAQPHATLSVINTDGSLLNATVGSTAEQTLTIKSSSSTQSAATITQISGLSGVLSIVPGGTCALNTTLNDTQTCTIKIKLNTANQILQNFQTLRIDYSSNSKFDTLTKKIDYSVLLPSSLKDDLLKLTSLINNYPSKGDADYKASLGIISSNGFKNAYSGLNEQNGPQAGVTTNAIIDNFVNTVTLFNNFIRENDNTPCTKESMENIWGWQKFPSCAKVTWLGYNNLGELYSLFDNANDNINKVRLALFFGNAWNESGGNIGLFNYCMQLKPSDPYPYSKCNNLDLESFKRDADTPNPFYFCKGEFCQFIGAGISQTSYFTNYANIANILNQMNEKVPALFPSDLKNILGTIAPPLCNSPAGRAAIPPNTDIDNKICIIGPRNDTNYSCPDNSIVKAPYQICTQPILAVLTSLLYESAQTERALRDNDYHSSIEFCSLNQGGYTYPFSTDISNNIQKVIDTDTCNDLEGGDARWEGLITILKLFFPGQIPSNAQAAWSIPMGDGTCYNKPADHNYAKMGPCSSKVAKSLKTDVSGHTSKGSTKGSKASGVSLDAKR